MLRGIARWVDALNGRGNVSQVHLAEKAFVTTPIFHFQI